jgi:hypothetical protein
MASQPNAKIATVVLTIRMTAGNSAGFEMRADEATTGGPGSLRFGASGIGHSNEGLVKEVLQKLIDAFPERPITLCLDGASIRPDAFCAKAPVLTESTAGGMVATAAPKPKATKKATGKTKTKTKTSTKRTATRKKSGA